MATRVTTRLSNALLLNIQCHGIYYNFNILIFVVKGKHGCLITFFLHKLDIYGEEYYYAVVVSDINSESHLQDFLFFLLPFKIKCSSGLATPSGNPDPPQQALFPINQFCLPVIIV